MPEQGGYSKVWCWLVHRIVWRPIAITGGRRCTLCERIVKAGAAHDEAI